MQSVYINAGTFESLWRIVDGVTSAAAGKMSTTFRMQDVRLGGKTLKYSSQEHSNLMRSVCALYSRIFSFFTMVNALFLLFSFISKDSIYKMASKQVLLLPAYVSLRSLTVNMACHKSKHKIQNDP